jgi:hypothetical protein
VGLYRRNTSDRLTPEQIRVRWPNVNAEQASLIDPQQLEAASALVKRLYKKRTSTKQKAPRGRGFFSPLRR